VRVLLTGSTGYLGGVLAEELAARGAEVVCAGRRGEGVPLDLAEPGSGARAVADVLPDRVLHCAAMAQAGTCAREPDAAMVHNGESTRALAEAAPGRLVFVSTDLVFGGDDAPYGPQAVPDPRLAYGRSKVAGEEAARRAGGCVVRIPLLFGAGGAGKGGSSDVVRQALAEDLGLFTNEYRTPVHVRDAARHLVDVTLGCWQPGQVHHVAGPERVSRHEFAVRWCRAQGRDASGLRAVACDDAARPRDVSLVGDLASGRSLDAMLADDAPAA